MNDGTGDFQALGALAGFVGGAVHPFLLGLTCVGVALWHGYRRPSATG
ncbi:hypothetical protein [Nonomuraea salmonea]